MKAILEVVKFNTQDVITASNPTCDPVSLPDDEV